MARRSTPSTAGQARCSSGGTILTARKTPTISSSADARLLRLSGRRLEASQISYPHTDHLGTAAAATDNSGNVLWREAFTPYGEVWGPEAAANDNQRGFTGHIRDTVSAASPICKPATTTPNRRKIPKSPDPVGFAEGGPDYFNRYGIHCGQPSEPN